MNARRLILAAVLLAPLTASAADLPVSYTVEAKPLKGAVAGTSLSFELYSDNTCATLLQSVPVAIENVSLLVALKQVTPKHDTKLPNTVELRTTLAGVTPATALYLKVTESGGTVVPVAGACQAQASGVAGPPGADASSRVVLSGATDLSVANNDFIGLGNSSSGFIRNSLVVPFNSTITTLVLNARNSFLASGQAITLSVYWSSQPNAIAPLNGSVSTGLSCTLVGPVPPNALSCTATGSFPVSAGDLISARVSSPSSIVDGVAWSVVLSP